VISPHWLWLPVTRALGLLVLASCPAGCLVSDPPEYEEPGLTPPFLDLVAATPLPGRIIAREFGTEAVVRFDVPFRSEDNGEEVYFGLYRNFTFAAGLSQEQRLVNSRSVPPGTFDETDRAIRFDWTVELRQLGCHQLTLLVSHESTWDKNEGRPHPLLSVGDTAMATWWFNYYAPGQDPSLLQRCPTLSGIEP
jgi:hypothetical protein